ncbi:S41 family peptidase [Pedobacter sp. GR22-10]|uniref:S41 family peptidase n=1 Tax=Pedobacter sp. GR22-10 TaxID=2994472 RepID=UPI0022482E17|nr:S41 family peptidase [Pedobacter sp. GR22-10]MCX2429856.1 S41 family peptidase [Pedobacter sp. GR22-10]
MESLIQKIKVDYPGYAEKTKNINFDQFINEVIGKNGTDTFMMMATIVDYFHDRHLDLFRTKDSIDKSLCEKNLIRINSYLNSGKKKKRYEGYWKTEANHCIIGIECVKEKPLQYRAYVVECLDSIMIFPGMLFLDFKQESKDNFFTKATGTRTGWTYYVHSLFRNDSVFTTGPYYKWKKINKYKAPLLPLLKRNSDSASGRWLDSITFMVSVPASSTANGVLIDTILNRNPAVKLKCRNLIIDVRNNTGGSVNAYDPLMPLLYTNPITYVNAAKYCSVDEGIYQKKVLDDYILKGGKDSTYIKYTNTMIKYHTDSAGKYVEWQNDTLKLDTIYAHPKNVGIVINFACQSACEIFLLDAKQSTKVKLFGEHTMGAIDYLNFYAQDLPSGKYKLYIATSRRIIPAGQNKLDGTGIYPDVPIADTEKDWIDFVKKYYEKH